MADGNKVIKFLQYVPFRITPGRNIRIAGPSSKEIFMVLFIKPANLRGFYLLLQWAMCPGFLFSFCISLYSVQKKSELH